MKRDPGVPLPWWKMYSREWLANAAIHGSSTGARAIVTSLLCLAHDSAEPGVVLIGGRHPSDKELAAAVFCDPRRIRIWLDELVSRGVFAADARGRLYCPRIVSAAAASARQEAHGRRGGNPYLLGPTHHQGADDAADGAKSGDGGKKVAEKLPKSGKSAAEKRKKSSQQSHDNRELRLLRVNPTVKVESESESESRRRGRQGASAVVAKAGMASGDNVVPLPVEPKQPEPPKPVRSWLPASGVKAPSEDEWRAVEAWNAAAEASGWMRQGLLNGPRLKALRARMREVGGLEGFVEVIGLASRSPLWQGQAGRGWRPGLDDILRARLFQNLREGKYDDLAPRAKLAPQGKARSGGLPDYLLERAGIRREDDDDAGPIIDAEACG